MTDAVLWSGLGLVAPLEARVGGKLAAGVGGVSIDTRTLEAGDLFFAIKGENSDGHDYVAAAFEKGAAACVVDEAHADALQGRRFTLYRARGAAGFGKARPRGTRAHVGADRRGDGIGRQDRDQGSLAAGACRGGGDPCLGRFLQQSLGRAADARPHAPGLALRRLRNRHESSKARSRRSSPWSGRMSQS